jgi:hypothetical protein
MRRSPATTYTLCLSRKSSPFWTKGGLRRFHTASCCRSSEAQRLGSFRLRPCATRFIAMDEGCIRQDCPVDQKALDPVRLSNEVSPYHSQAQPNRRFDTKGTLHRTAGAGGKRVLAERPVGAGLRTYNAVAECLVSALLRRSLKDRSTHRSTPPPAAPQTAVDEQREERVCFFVRWWKISTTDETCRSTHRGVGIRRGSALLAHRSASSRG